MGLIRNLKFNVDILITCYDIKEVIKDFMNSVEIIDESLFL